MKTKISTLFMSLTVVPINTDTAASASASNSPVSYLIGAIVALLIMGYLIYTLLRPDKF
jgi:K+-transporting ATPase KdpF subunit